MANLIDNGSFVAHADGWYPNVFGDGVAWAASPSRSGGGAIECDASAGSMVSYRPDGAYSVSLGGLTAIDCVAYARSADTARRGRVRLEFFSDASCTSFVSGITVPDSTGVALDDAGWHEVAARGIAVPGGATRVLVSLAPAGTKGAEPVVFADVYVGDVGGDGPPYPGAAISLGYRLPNGDFETVQTDYAVDNGTEVVTFDTVAPIAGTRSLKIVCAGADAFDGVLIPTAAVAIGMVVIPGETLPWSFKLDGSGIAEVDVGITFQGATPADVSIYTGAPTGTVAGEIAVPAGAWRASMWFWTTSADAGTFRIDDVLIGTSVAADADPPTVDTPIHGRDRIPPELTDRDFPGRGPARPIRIRR